MNIAEFPKLPFVFCRSTLQPQQGCQIMSVAHSILHIEDDPNDVVLVQRAFNKAKIAATVRHAHDGEEAADYLLGQNGFSERQNHPLPQLLLLDLKLPKRNGLEFIAWLRKQHAPLNRLPVVVLTSSNQTNDINRAYELGANAYMVKPSGFEELLNVVKVLNQYWFIHSEKPEV